jgi:Domain of unknown function (DUF1905)
VKKLEFQVKLEGIEGTHWAALTPSFNIQVLQTRGRVPVRGTINGFRFRSSVMPMAGCQWVVNRTIRDGASVKAGDTVTVQMERDQEERVVEVSQALANALDKSREARTNSGETLLYTAKENRAFDRRIHARRNASAAARKSDRHPLTPARRKQVKVLASQPLAQDLPAEKGECLRSQRRLLRGRNRRFRGSRRLGRAPE